MSEALPGSPRRHVRATIAAVAVTGLLVGTVGWFWWTSLVPASYSVMAMGYVDPGGGPAVSGHEHGAGSPTQGGPVGPVTAASPH